MRECPFVGGERGEVCERARCVLGGWVGFERDDVKQSRLWPSPATVRRGCRMENGREVAVRRRPSPGWSP
jgi:hypothetical protein